LAPGVAEHLPDSPALAAQQEGLQQEAESLPVAAQAR